MAFFGEKPDIALTLARHEFVTGERTAARVEIGSGSDDKLEAIRVELGYVNTYYYRRWRSSDGDDDYGDREDAVAVETVVVATEQIPLDHPALAAGGGTLDVALVLPGDPPASVKRWVEWNVTAILDRRRARDRRHAVPITVLASRPASPAGTGAQKVSDEDRCDMFLELPASAVRIGETLAGVLHVNPGDRFEARRVRLRLEQRVHHEDRIEHSLGKEEVVLADRTEFVPGAPQRFAFQIFVPADGAPSMRAKHNEVRWTLTGSCNRRLRGDYEVVTDLAVYNAPPGVGA